VGRKSGNQHRAAMTAGVILARQQWRRWLPVLAALVLVLAVQATLAPSRASADPTQTGQWTAPFNIGVVGIHAQVMPNSDNVLFWQYPKNTTGTKAVLFNTDTLTGIDVTQSYQRDGFCAGNDLLPNGEVFDAGGHLYNSANPGSHEDGNGAPQTDLFDPSTNTWTPGPLLATPRWYPTNIETADGKIDIFSGQVNPTTKAAPVEQYDPATNTMTTLPATASKSMPVYPRMTLLPNGLMLNSEPNAYTNLFNPATNTWKGLGNTAFRAARTEGSAVQLANLNQVLIAGGKNGSGATATAEIIDFSQAKPAWHLTGSMNFARAYANTVLLPDGTVLEVGGGTSGSYTTTAAVKTAELYNPATGTWSVMAAQTAPRIYHSTAVLLPDGRVLSAGMDSGTYQNTAEIYSPPYLFAGPRPTITSAPSTVGYGQQFTVTTPDAANITSAVLVKPPGVTHAMQQDQREVPLQFTQTADGTGLTMTAPADGNHAPPGWYMLFILNSSGVPSVASWVQVG